LLWRLGIARHDQLTLNQPIPCDRVNDGAGLSGLWSGEFYAHTDYRAGFISPLTTRVPVTGLLSHGLADLMANENTERPYDAIQLCWIALCPPG
jgi:hypothetical protein